MHEEVQTDRKTAPLSLQAMCEDPARVRGELAIFSITKPWALAYDKTDYCEGKGKQAEFDLVS